MAKLTKKQKAIEEKYDLSVAYPLDEAIKMVKNMHQAAFDASVDIAVNLSIDIKKPEQMVRAVVIFPHGTGKLPRILVICQPEKEQEAKEAGADFVGCDEYLKKIEKGWADVDVIITQPSLMAKLGRLGRQLGPKKLMPSPKTGNVTEAIGEAVRQTRLGKVAIHTNKTGGILTSAGRVSFSVEKLVENIEELMGTIKRKKHSTVKGQYIKSIFLSSTMGPGVEVAKNTIKTL